jgi:ATP-binding cassette subfamily B protein
MEQYEDDEAARKRVLTNAQVLAFIAGFWARRPGLFAATIALYLAAVGFELMVPRASQGLVDAAVAGPAHVASAWRAWALFLGDGAAAVARHVGL